MSLPALSPLTVSLAARPTAYEGLQTHTAADAAAAPRYRGQTAGSTGTGHCREEYTHTHTQRTDTHTTHHLA